MWVHAVLPASAARALVWVGVPRRCAGGRVPTVGVGTVTACSAGMGGDGGATAGECRGAERAGRVVVEGDPQRRGARNPRVTLNLHEHAAGGVCPGGGGARSVLIRQNV